MGKRRGDQNLTLWGSIIMHFKKINNYYYSSKRVIIRHKNYLTILYCNRFKKTILKIKITGVGDLLTIN